ncbi:hypothetical protein GUJ93_ZPchr0002g25444 [Zizania palustris]|uniref:NAD(P)-binding domain-containing protein n=1 Tax=Zizania palustris TaxID=103762 RepID=A0A8J5S8W3_ZIZPA|nr:hypothetical protein GUJ93_ZPchr0002g25444 [Zizania palustris]
MAGRRIFLGSEISERIGGGDEEFVPGLTTTSRQNTGEGAAYVPWGRRRRAPRGRAPVHRSASFHGLISWALASTNPGIFRGRRTRDAGRFDEGTDASIEFSENGQAVFSGFVFTRGGYVEVSKRISLPLGSTLDRYDGLLLSVGGNGRSYVIILETGPLADTSQSKKYFARMNTKVGFCRVRVPFSDFRPVNPQDPPLDPFLVHTLTIRFEPQRQRPGDSSQGASDSRNFELVMEFIKALPTGQETDIVLVSCTGSGIEPNRREQVLKAKKAGEDALRRSGLGYTIIRPGPLQVEPGGQRALIFDQGNRISQGFSCADVADICVKALHDPTARNKSFDVCYEHVSKQGDELYELVVHLPDKANNYLAPALSVLEKNT